MLNTFFNLLLLLLVIIPKYLRIIIRYNFFFKKELHKIIKQKKFDLDKKYIKRINFFGLYSYIFANWFSVLHNKKLTYKEIKSAVYFGFCNPLFDDLIDELNFSKQQLEDLKNNKNYIFENKLDELLYDIFIELSKYYSNKNLFNKFYTKLLDAQILSKKQTSKTISQKEVEQITLKKGGYSLLLSRVLFDKKITETEKDAIFFMGGLFQYINDMFDIYEDYNSGITTLPIQLKYSDLLSSFFDIYFKQFFEKFKQTNFKKINKRIFILNVLLVTNRGKICAEQLKKFGVSEDSFEFKIKNREIFICDMEKISNIYKLIKKTLKFNYF